MKSNTLTSLRMVDLRHVDTGLSAAERRDAIYEGQRLLQQRALGERHLLHPSHAPRKGLYNPLTGARVA